MTNHKCLCPHKCLLTMISTCGFLFNIEGALDFLTRTSNSKIFLHSKPPTQQSPTAFDALGPGAPKNHLEFLGCKRKPKAPPCIWVTSLLSTCVGLGCIRPRCPKKYFGLFGVQKGSQAPPLGCQEGCNSGPPFSFNFARRSTSMGKEVLPPLEVLPGAKKYFHFINTCTGMGLFSNSNLCLGFI